jgi:hypothetical protein
MRQNRARRLLFAPRYQRERHERRLLFGRPYQRERGALDPRWLRHVSRRFGCGLRGCNLLRLTLDNCLLGGTSPFSVRQVRLGQSSNRDSQKQPRGEPSRDQHSRAMPSRLNLHRIFFSFNFSR